MQFLRRSQAATAIMFRLKAPASALCHIRASQRQFSSGLRLLAELPKDTTIARDPAHPEAVKRAYGAAPLNATATSGSSTVIEEAIKPVSNPASTIQVVKPGRFRKWTVRIGRTTLFIVLTTAGWIVYKSYVQRHPPTQLDFDPTKKRLVVLGNGWAATSFLKNLDTTEYNVVRARKLYTE